MRSRRIFRACVLTALVSLAALAPQAYAQAQPASGPASAEPKWYKGNLHTHSLWSDGDEYPDMIADWYKRQGYHFLGISDHNVLQQGVRWLELKTPVSFAGTVTERGGGRVLEKYLRWFGPDWVEQREIDGKRSVRLKPLSEYRSLLEEPGRFLMIPSEEITSTWKRAKTATTPELSGPVHINVTNPREFVAPASADNAVEIMNQVVDAVAAQRERTGQPMFAHINHPNFRWGVTAEELTQVKGERFFEVYNGHPGVNNAGDATRLGMDAMWDVMLTRRLTELALPVVYGVGVDDSHHYHEMAIGKSNPGRGWVMVRAAHLTAEAIVKAMEAGDFYATSGVTLDEVKREKKQLSIVIKGDAGVTYRTQFIGTRKGFSPVSEEIPPTADQPQRTLPHRRYSKDIGAILSEVQGTKAGYTLRDDDIYVRAKVISSRPKENGSVAGEFETAWTQPLVNADR
jgi:hypothetical protein